MERAWYTDIFRSLFGMLDGIVYSLISTAYTLLVEIAHFRVFDDATLEDFATRIYAILGIVMLFKLSFSFINYMINPDSFTDKEKGIQNLIKNIIIMFAMLIMFPWVFEQLWGLQAAILDDNIIPRFVFGSVSSTSSTDKYIEECDDDEVINNDTEHIGNYMATMVLRGFYQPYDNSELKDTDEYDDVIDLLCDASTRNITYMLSDSIYNEYADLVWGWGGNTYIMEYRFGISTVVGVVVLLILVNFCMDVGVRMVKLSFLQLIAPIPIISYIDPASGKNGIFKKWLKEVGSTWVSIFIKLFSLFFAVYAIQHIGKLVPVGNDTTRQASIWVQIFVIIGALMFAKQLPKLIHDITGINMDGGFNLNPMKKVRDQALGGKFVTGAVTGAAAGGLALAGGVAANTWNLGNKIKKDGLQKALLGVDKDGNTRKFWNGRTGIGAVGAGLNSIRRGFNNSVGSVTVGGISSAGRAIYKGKDGTWHPIKNATSGVKASSQARNLRGKGYGMNDKVKDYLTDVAGIKFSTGTTSQLKEEVNRLEQALANSKRNEQAMTNALNERIASMGNLSADLLRIFDGEADTHDAKGNITAYKTKTYEQYAERAARLEAENQGANWDTLTAVQKNGYISQAEHFGTIVDRTTFDSFNELYKARNEEDIKGRGIERDINDYKENMDKFKNRKS